jgi:hypothetical protein
LRWFHLVRTVRDSLRDRIIQPMSGLGVKGSEVQILSARRRSEVVLAEKHRYPPGGFETMNETTRV